MEDYFYYIKYAAYLSIIPIVYYIGVYVNTYWENEKKSYKFLKKYSEKKIIDLREHALYERMLNKNRVIILKDKPKES